MSATEYLVGVVLLVVGVGALVFGAVRLRSTLLPQWTGAHARLAETIVAVGVAVGVSELLGIIGIFRRGPVVAGFVVFAIVVRFTCPASRSRAPAAPPALPPLRRTEVAVATFGVVLVVGQWITQVVDAFRYGMTHADTIWYHGPHAARFLQDGSITQQLGYGSAQETYSASNSELIHAIVMLPFHRDLLSPLVNLGWMAVALLAAWCLGRRRGVGPTCLLGAAMVLSLPVLAGSQPGQGSTDIPAAALLVAAAALLLHEPRSHAAVGVAAVAAGLAIATKPTVGSAVAIITVGVLIAAVRARTPATAALWIAGVVVAGSYWYAKNILTVGNPFPGVPIGIGPFSLPLGAPEYQCCPIADVITDRHAWEDAFLPGLRQALTQVWPLVLLLTVLGGVLTLVQGRDIIERATGAAVLGNAIGYLFTPLSAGGIFHGLFLFNLRHLTAALLLGCVLLPRCPFVSARGRWWLGAVPFVLVLLFGYFARHYEHAPAWPVQHAAGLVLVLAATAAVLVLVVGPWPPVRPRWRARPLVIGAVAVGLVVAVGWPVQRVYFDGRYRTLRLRQDPFSFLFNDLRHQRVALFRSADEYALFGSDLTNIVRRVEAPAEAPATSARGRRVASCRAWREALRDYDYVVLASNTMTPGPWPEPWVSTDPASTVVDRGDHHRVIRIAAALDPDGCERAAESTAADQPSPGEPSSGTPST
jgi:hypothetical protein